MTLSRHISRRPSRRLALPALALAAAASLTACGGGGAALGEERTQTLQTDGSVTNQPDRSGDLTATLVSIEKATEEQKAGMDTLYPEDNQKAAAYLLRWRYTNASGGNFGGATLSSELGLLDGLTSDGELIESAIDTSGICEAGQAPESFSEQGATVEVCMPVFTDGEEITGGVWRPQTAEPLTEERWQQ